MKRMTLLLGAAAAIATGAPVSAKAQTCTWWNLACNGLAPVVVDNGWHIAGHDANGNVLYMRRRVDSNGNLVFEQARRTSYGNYFITNNHKVHTVKPRAIKYDHDIKGAKPHKVHYHAVQYKPAKIHGAKVHEVKFKGPKH